MKPVNWCKHHCLIETSIATCCTGLPCPMMNYASRMGGVLGWERWGNDSSWHKATTTTTTTTTTAEAPHWWCCWCQWFLITITNINNTGISKFMILDNCWNHRRAVGGGEGSDPPNKVMKPEGRGWGEQRPPSPARTQQNNYCCSALSYLQLVISSCSSVKCNIWQRWPQLGNINLGSVK